VRAAAPDLIILLPTLGFFLVAFIAGRAWALLLPVISWTLWFLGLRERWWGNGLGDNWHYAFAGVTLLGLAAAAAGLGLRATVRAAASPGGLSARTRTRRRSR
jgi:hypothetical protein